MFDLRYFGPALGLLRRLRRLEVPEVALRVGTTRRVISGYEDGVIEPSLPSLSKLLEVLECSLATLEVAMMVIEEKEAAATLAREICSGPSTSRLRVAKAALGLVEAAFEVLFREAGRVGPQIGKPWNTRGGRRDQERKH